MSAHHVTAKQEGLAGHRGSSHCRGYPMPLRIAAIGVLAHTEVQIAVAGSPPFWKRWPLRLMSVRLEWVRSRSADQLSGSWGRFGIQAVVGTVLAGWPGPCSSLG